MAEPYMVAWADQFGALLREKVYQMMKAIEVTGWTKLATEFDDPYDDDEYRLMFDGEDFLLLNLAHPDGEPVLIDINRLGIA